jgi:hypothetical protein
MPTTHTSGMVIKILACPPRVIFPHPMMMAFNSFIRILHAS